MNGDNSIYGLKLHEYMIINNFWVVLRVPGGWIYMEQRAGQSNSGVFVPFDNEFQGDKR